ncbi:MAG: haloacid dehalogenase type II, partial [Nitratireductor sp.]|nr:haloacid dehalogenase type II [Nitratireductor sp.]
RHAEETGPHHARVSEIWRNKQLEYSWTRSGMGRYRDFWSLTEEALDFALAVVPGANKAAKANLMRAYETLDCFGEVPEVLRTLKARGSKLAILSNGSPAMLESAVVSAGLGEWLDDVFSIDAVGVFKTDPATYRMVTDAYGAEPQEIIFQSSNRWDIAGATAFGFTCNWVNRSGQPDEYRDLPPVAVFKNLRELL